MALSVHNHSEQGLPGKKGSQAETPSKLAPRSPLWGAGQLTLGIHAAPVRAIAHTACVSLSFLFEENLYRAE